MTHHPSYALAIHGGAGVKPDRSYQKSARHLSQLIEKGEYMLADGATALDTVQEMVRELEISGLYVAGRGSAPNSAGFVETDAAIMDGPTRRAGAIAAVRNLVSPVDAARQVMEKTPHILLAGEGADRFCQTHQLELVDDPDAWYLIAEGATKEEVRSDQLAHGTVGAVALDKNGRLAAATSTGGLFGKLAGRVGDTALIGSGTWADDSVAISCTGVGEYFIRTSAAKDVAARVTYANSPLNDAAAATLSEIKRLGGDGGLIAIDRRGTVSMPFNSDGMKRASVREGEAPVVAIT